MRFVKQKYFDAIEIKNFQFSLWDSGKKEIGRSKSIPSFNSLYEIRNFIMWTLFSKNTFNSLYEIRKLNFIFNIHFNFLSILFMRFKYYVQKVCLNISSFNSLYEILTPGFWVKSRVNSLSILFMRFRYSIGRP